MNIDKIRKQYSKRAEILKSQFAKHHIPLDISIIEDKNNGLRIKFSNREPVKSDKYKNYVERGERVIDELMYADDTWRFVAYAYYNDNKLVMRNAIDYYDNFED